MPFAQLVEEAGPSVTCIVLQNVEAIPQKLAVDCIFEDLDLFCLDIHSLLAYANGKSAGRCGFCTWLGPHRYTGRSVVVDADRAALLHFESCTYEMWRNKFSKHRHMEARKKVDIDKIPFPFYRESIRLFQASRAARWGHGPRGEAREGATPRASEPHAHDPLHPSAHPPTTPPRASSRPDCAAQDDPTGGKNEERWRAFFVERKIKHFDHVVRAPCSLAITPAFDHVVRSSAAARPRAPPFPFSPDTPPIPCSRRRRSSASRCRQTRPPRSILCDGLA